MKGSHYISGAQSTQSTKLGSGFVACLQMPWFLTPPDHQYASRPYVAYVHFADPELPFGVDFFHIPVPYACQGMLENLAFDHCVTSVTWTYLSLYLIIT